MLNSFVNGESQVQNGTRTIRFGAFEADLLSGEVRKSGTRVKLQDQPFQVLQILLENPGKLVAREELQRQEPHADEIGTVDPLEALGDHGADAEQARPLGRPVA